MNKTFSTNLCKITVDKIGQRWYNHCIKGFDRKEVSLANASQRAVGWCKTVGITKPNTFRELLLENYSKVRRVHPLQCKGICAVPYEANLVRGS